MAGAFEKRGWQPLRMLYPNDGDIAGPAEFLRGQLLELSRRPQRPRVIVVAHSLGGLVAWSALTGEPAGQPPVTDLVTLGTPFDGSTLTIFQEELELADVAMRLVIGDTSSLDILGDGSGEAIDYLLPVSPKRRELLRRPLPAGIRLHCVAGTGGPVDPTLRAGLRRSVDGLIVNLQPAPAMAAKLRRLAACDEIVTGLGDGAVTVRSALAAPGAISTRIAPVSHGGFLAPTAEADAVLDWVMGQLEGF